MATQIALLNSRATVLYSGVSEKGATTERHRVRHNNDDTDKQQARVVLVREICNVSVNCVAIANRP